MPPLNFGLLTISFGLSAETGGQIQNVEVKQSRSKALVNNSTGEPVAACYFAPVEEITADWLPTGLTGVGAASPGAALTLANYSPGAGIILVEEVTTTRANSDYKKVSVKANVYPLITS